MSPLLILPVFIPLLRTPRLRLREAETRQSHIWAKADPTGYVGQELTKLLLTLYPGLRLVTTDMNTPPTFVDDTTRLRVVKADLGAGLAKQLDKNRLEE